jgi:hypothetical protein
VTLRKQHVWLLVETTSLGKAHVEIQLELLLRNHEQVVQTSVRTHEGHDGLILRVGIDYVPKPSQEQAQIARWWKFKVSRWLDGYQVFGIDVEGHCVETRA